MFTEGALIEMAIKVIGGGLAAIVAVVGLWWGGKRSGRKQRQQEIDRDRYEATERARDVEADVSRRGPDAARDSLRRRIEYD